MNRAILFDLDGTLVDTAPDIATAAGWMLEELGAAGLPLATVREFIGHGVPSLVRRALAASGLAETVTTEHAVAAFDRHYRDANGAFGEVYPGVRDGLAALQEAGYRMACVTNKPLAFALPLLESTRLARYFRAVVGGDSVTQMKPDPEPLLHACRALQVDVQSCVMVGDSGVDVAAARAAGMPVYLVRYGYPGVDGHRGLHYDALIDSFTELRPLLDPA